MSNRLASAQSAYLRQHADNPVDWWPWSAQAFAEAQRRDVPVFISIGYAACHWCHVMARESFEDDAAAELLNARFVAIKVDREERPDVDDTYMAAVQAMTGMGGWPMSVFATPQGRVFHAGTYFPPQRRGQVPSFSEVCDAVHEAWTQRRDQVESQAEDIAEALAGQRRQQSQMATAVQTDREGSSLSMSGEVYADLRARTLDVLAEQEDEGHGGFGAAPKFPPSPLLGWLLEDSAWNPEHPSGQLALRTMAAMGRSALFDHVEGGFARYATDRAWALPHFEKMLYDNAQLLGHYARLSRHTAADAGARADAERIARMTIEWLRERLLLDDSGLLASSLDADTVLPDGTHAEGGTYIFSDAELAEAARESGLSDEEARRAVELNRGVPADEHAVASGAPLSITAETPRTVHFDAPLNDEERALWDAMMPALRRRRASRSQASLDRKVVASWNAQAVQSVAEAAALWEDAELLDFAESLAERLWETHTDEEGRVCRTSYAGKRGTGVGTLSDHAHLISACFALASAGAGSEWAARAAHALRFTATHFVQRSDAGLEVLDTLDEEGLLHAAQAGAAHASPFDGSEPSPIAALAAAVQQAEAFAVDVDLPMRSGELLQHVAPAAPRAPIAVGSSLLALRRSVQQSPALRLFGGSPEDAAQVRRTGALLGIPVEPPAPGTVSKGAELRVAVCLNGPETSMCLVPQGDLRAALAPLS
ncbi:thioredoxin domain-containing protein [Nesterenkonia sp. NBAIMH1]|uniref:thioredoxin domain-containing protein n=1 Tax=Nesterenkonia sp. NBAIMH1 TaxID=2600320 RepID=UPI0011B64575|nr:DUF255 domain-containing protein [Nesterenkonia sp. NBAIMH1]